MKRSEFWAAVDEVYGSALGRSYTSDLYLVTLGSTACDALDAGVDPNLIWDALVTETGMGEQARWIHRIDPKERARRRR
ncbi:MAG: DUF732 domain-containing protein [Actinomycetaceae bacterium]|nr:DUF732 domain-containing protein [Actinomycetaceae bacterium]